jgi:glutamyl-tRNA reductase
MPLLSVASSYRDVPLDELERLSIPSSLLPDAVPCLLRAPAVQEALVLSTCNRTEIYAWASDPIEATEQIRLFIEDLRDLPIGWTEQRVTVQTSDDVIRHLFRVAAGLDSMVQGESEIQGQVREAYRMAASMGAVGPHLHGLFRWALEAGKRVRRTTGLARATDSFPRAAQRAIDATLRGVAGKEVLVVGNGRMASATLRHLRSDDVRLGIIARRLEAAQEMAATHDAFALPMHALEDALIGADAVVFATSSPEPLIGSAGITRALAGRDGRPLVVVDLGLPRNVDPRVADIDATPRTLHLFDLASLDSAGFTAPGGRDAQLRAAADIIAAEAERCVAWFRAKPADSVVAAIQAQAVRMAREEAETAAKRIKGLDDAQRAAVQRAIEKTVRRVVHLPTVRTKEACARGDEHLLQAARWLFGLEDADAAVSSSMNGTAHSHAAEGAER